jgi:hypothetical protein
MPFPNGLLSQIFEVLLYARLPEEEKREVPYRWLVRDEIETKEQE